MMVYNVILPDACEARKGLFTLKREFTRENDSANKWVCKCRCDKIFVTANKHLTFYKFRFVQCERVLRN